MVCSFYLHLNTITINSPDRLTTMKQILVALNLRSDYQNILDYACSLASRSQASITLYYAGAKRLFVQGNTLVLSPEEGHQKLDERFKPSDVRKTLHGVIDQLQEAQVNFRLKLVAGSAVYGMVREANTSLYDLLIMGSHHTTNLLGYFRGSMANRVMGDVKVPVFVVPAKTPFSGIEHISYAVDLAEYDPEIIRQVREIAALFDAKLSIVHVNEGKQGAEVEKSSYRDCLEQTISATLDYPKIYYKFFDHADPFGGILKHLSNSNSNLLAMTNRKSFSWSSIFSSKSLTHKMAKELQVPLLAFRK